ncbi:MAG: helicase-associated domain-containing protein [Bacillus sp. (in: Bacteria)]|nr:helicase-associated domain-containing protein [Bacillus sp. (in: firmicutes)]
MVAERKAIWVQTDGTIFLKTDHKEAKIVQPFLSQFAQLVKTPSTIHIYKLSPFSVWYALEQGVTMKEIIDFLESFSDGVLPVALLEKLEFWNERNGKLELRNIDGKGPCLYSYQSGLLNTLFDGKETEILPMEDGEMFPISIKERGSIKQFLMTQEYPVIDRLGVEQGTPLAVQLKNSVSLRPYQKEAVQSFVDPKGVYEGNGFIILPCGSGKTIVGLGVMNEIKEDTLILVPNDTSLQQWYKELMEKTSLEASQIGIYTSEKKRSEISYHHYVSDVDLPQQERGAGISPLWVISRQVLGISHL